MIGTLDQIEQKIVAGEWDAAEDALKAAAASGAAQADVHFLRGLLKDRQFDREGAVACFDEALDADPEHSRAAFQSGVLSDQLGDNDAAIEFFEQSAGADRAPVNALINLAILYEERGELCKAEACLESVIAEHPNHTRARQFLKSVRSAYTMVYDETRQRENEQRSAILDVPITDFELSVRSRNCLKQMGIRTLGDILQTTEVELMAYKNFGETSLAEIKALLDQRGMTIGQSLQPAAEPAYSPPPVEVTGAAVEQMQRPIAELELSVRSRKCLQRLGVSKLGELIQHSEIELMTNKNFGQTSLNEIKRQLAQFGLGLRR
jgi:DNA-directed RNA polymerase subunit alpha